MFRKTILILALSGAIASPAFAQGGGPGFPGTPSDFFGSSGGTAGATGWQDNTTGFKTGAQAIQGWTDDVNTGVDIAREMTPPGRTMSTMPGSLTAGGLSGANLPQTTTTQYGVGPGVTVNIHQLPPTRLSSFVADSGFDDKIYGLEGETDVNPAWASGFQAENTIGAGIVEPYLSTGHASPLPSAWLDTGADGNFDLPDDPIPDMPVGPSGGKSGGGIPEGNGGGIPEGNGGRVPGQ